MRLIELSGRPTDLALLHKEIQGAGLAVVVKEGVTYLQAADVDAAPDVNAAAALAKRLVDRVNGAATVFDSRYSAVRAIDIIETAPDGTRIRHSLDATPRLAAIHTMVGNPHVRVGEGIGVELDKDTGRVAVRSPDGTLRPIPPKPDLTEWITLARNDADVAVVLEIAASDAVRWAVLYRTVGTVRHLAGGNWCTAVGKYLAAKEPLFSHSANAPAPGAVDKRHGPGHRPPRSPMALLDAELYARQVVAAFIRWKAGAA